MARINLNNEHYEFNTGWQKVIKTNDELKSEDLNQKFKKLNEELEEIKRQIELIKTTINEDFRNQDKNDMYSEIEYSLGELEGRVDKFINTIDEEIKDINKKFEEHKKNIETQVGFIQDTIKLIIEKIDNTQKNSGLFSIFRR